jgi:hypothetical protein
MATIGRLSLMAPVEPKKRASEAEHPAVGGHQPVARPAGRGGHGHDRLVELHPAGGAEEGRTPEAEDAAVGGHEPRPGPGAGGGRVGLRVGGTAGIGDRRRRRQNAGHRRRGGHEAAQATPTAVGATDGAHLLFQFTARPSGSCPFGVYVLSAKIPV